MDFETLDFGLWTSDFGLRTSDFGLRTLDFLFFGEEIEIRSDPRSDLWDVGMLN